MEWISKYQALVAACIAVLGVFFTAYIAMYNNNKNILIKTVTEERSKWRSEMRSLCSEFISIAYNTKNEFNDEKLNKLLKITQACQFYQSKFFLRILKVKVVLL